MTTWPKPEFDEKRKHKILIEFECNLFKCAKIDVFPCKKNMF